MLHLNRGSIFIQLLGYYCKRGTVQLYSRGWPEVIVQNYEIFKMASVAVSENGDFHKSIKIWTEFMCNTSKIAKFGEEINFTCQNYQTN